MLKVSYGTLLLHVSCNYVQCISNDSKPKGYGISITVTFPVRSELVTISADGQLTLFKVIEGATLSLQPTFHQLMQANISELLFYRIGDSLEEII